MRVGYAILLSLAGHGAIFFLPRSRMPVQAEREIAPIVVGEAIGPRSRPAGSSSRRVRIAAPSPIPEAKQEGDAEEGRSEVGEGPGSEPSSGTATFGEVLGWGNAPPEYPRE